VAIPFIAGRYAVHSQLSAGGGGGEVYEVYDSYEGEIVVLKFIRNVPTGNPWHEAQILRRLSDPHILPIRNADIASGIPYVVTEHATHGTLETRLNASTGLGADVGEVIQWMRQASYGVARAHDLRLTHNDIKPANLFLNAQSEALVGDFGGASLIAPGATTTMPFQATAETVAPEIAVSWGTPATTASFASDVYSLGATTYWMLAATTPHDFTGVVGQPAMIQHVANNPSRHLRDVAPHIPQSVAAVVERAIRRDPMQRFATVLEFAAALTSRSLPDRWWRRTNVHSNHMGCWQGDPVGMGGAYLLCLEQGQRTSQCLITTVHANSGSRVSRGCRTAPKRSWAQAVRAVIQELG
jgi:serine/threonine-protein kinase